MKLTVKDFTDLLVSEQPKYDRKVLKLICPTDGWIGHCPSFHFRRGTGITQFYSPYDTYGFPAFSGTESYQDRFSKVWPTQKSWHHKTRIPIGMHT